MAPFTSLFVAGAHRSGSSLLEKLLCNHPRLSVLSQPSPQLFVDVKRAFLGALGVADDELPLGNLFRESRYEPAALVHFLQTYRMDGAALRATFERGAGYSGTYTAFDAAQMSTFVDAVAPATLDEVLEALYRGFAHRADAVVFGAKETGSEEFLPYLLSRGFAGIVILRDPRDLIASLSRGRASEFTGRRKPTLFNIRNWRKSVAIALHLEREEGFVCIRYEDLCAEPVRELNRVASVLGIGSFDERAVAGELRDQQGRVWAGNSSHAPRALVSSSSVGTFAQHLSPDVVRYVEATCLPELVALGYTVSLDADGARDVIHTFRDPEPLERAELRSYLDHDARAREELRRLELLQQAGVDDARAYFVFDDVRDRLARCVTA